MLEHLFLEQMGWGWQRRHQPTGLQGVSLHRLFTACSMGMASLEVQRDPGMCPIILLGLVMEPEASCTWETQKHQSQHVPFIPLEQVKGLPKGGMAPRPVHCLSSCSPWPLSERPFRAWEALQGGELFSNTFPPCFVPGEGSEAGWDMWYGEPHRSSRINTPFPIAPSQTQETAVGWGGGAGSVTSELSLKVFCRLLFK